MTELQAQTAPAGELAGWLSEARQRTFAVIEGLSPEQLIGPFGQTVNPILWAIGHWVRCPTCREAAEALQAMADGEPERVGSITADRFGPHTIAQLGYLMEISPDDDRPAYSGYFNALVAPAALLPLAGGVLVKTVGPTAVFAVSAGAALVQWLVVRRLQPALPGDST